ncbi:MAG: T9SS type A sorting domain-containing protein [bacterium]|nr:T9SS type A sorting domain-containing protein [bacterium]
MNRVVKTLLLCSLAVAMSAAVKAQEDQPCISLRSITAECAGFNADGRPRYVIKFHATDINKEGDVLYISSETGHVGTTTYKLPLENEEQVFRYVHVGNSLKACFTFTVYNMTEDGRRKLCRVEKCIELPRCAPKCSDVRKSIEARPHLASNGEDIILSGALGFSPFGVGAVQMEVVDASHRRVCSNTERSAWQPIRTEISRAAIKGVDGPHIEGNIALWKFDPCVRFNPKRGFEILINLPPACPTVSTSSRVIECTDTIKFCVKYTVLICPELRCDTVICYRIIRKCRTGGPNQGINLGNAGSTDNTNTLNEAVILTAASVVSVPNPATDETDVILSMPYDDANASVDIVDLNGQVVATIASGLKAGQTTVNANLHGMASGTYMLRLRHTGGLISEPIRIVR